MANEEHVHIVRGGSQAIDEWRARTPGGRLNLFQADLREAQLRGANLRGADLRGAELRDADLREADLRETDLRGASLYEADLSGADITDSDLSGADLMGADLLGAVLRRTVLRRSILHRADLRDADFRDADLDGAYLDGAYLRGALMADTVPRVPLSQFFDTTVVDARTVSAARIIAVSKASVGEDVRISESLFLNEICLDHHATYHSLAKGTEIPDRLALLVPLIAMALSCDGAQIFQQICPASIRHPSQPIIASEAALSELLDRSILEFAKRVAYTKLIPLIAEADNCRLESLGGLLLSALSDQMQIMDETLHEPTIGFLVAWGHPMVLITTPQAIVVCGAINCLDAALSKGLYRGFVALLGGGREARL